MDDVEIRIRPEAAAWLRRRGVRDVTVESFVVAGCCAPDLPPVVQPGPPRHPEGFRCFEAGEWRVHVDPLLPLPRRLTIAARPLLAGGEELVVADWPGAPAATEPAPGVMDRHGRSG